jgi:Glycosyltransferase
MHAMIEGYHSAGWEVYLLSMNTSRHYIDKGTLREIYKDIFRFETIDVSNDVKLIPTMKNFFFSNKPSHAERFDDIRYADKVKQVLEVFKPAVVQVESVFLTGYLHLIGNTNTILRLHNVEYQVWERLAATATHPLKKYYLNNLAARIKKYEEWAWQQYDRLLPITDIDAGIVKKHLPEAKMLTVPFGIDTNDISESQTGAWIAYHIGAMDWLPNEEAIKWFLTEVWPEVSAQHAGFQFHYAGRKMPEYFSRLNIPGAICAGEVPDANTFIADKRVLVVPLNSGGGIRVKILEAMAAGKLVVSTAIGMQGIDAIPGKHYMLANNKDEFLAAFNTILADTQAAEQMAYNGAAFVKNTYSSRAIMHKLLDWLAR